MNLEWQIKEVQKRLSEYKNNPKHALDFNAAMDDLERDF